MTGGKTGVLVIDLTCENCFDDDTSERTEMVLVDDVDSDDQALYECTNCKHRVLLAMHLGN